MAARFSKPVRQLWLKSIERYQREHLLVLSSLNFEQSQQHSPRMAAEVPLLPHPRGKKPRKILRLSVPREQQKQTPAKCWAEKSNRQEAPRESFNRFCASGHGI
ncbi:hypothetical protein PoB_005927800 [Plakobranchus ocellatus]|uniref:Uncharacterized protein n=1 Tax=Plakobranchus ocellatus TaxID=259542 RepID=A0AAV4CMY6_9GAST|nr:hypothetical protein PoB_005927800 [Plakobranchus ocellatus]